MKRVPAAPAMRVVVVLAALSFLVNCGTNTGLHTITVTPANPTVAKGENLQFVATGSYGDGTQQTLTDSVTWQTTKPTVATIGDQGQITGMGEGASQISATYQGVTGNTYVTVGAPVLVGISVSPSPSSLPLGQSEQLTATGKFSDGSTQTLAQSVTWSSSGSSVASVGPTGSVLAAGMGTATITATSGSINGTASVTVGQAVLLGITVSPNPSSVPLGESEQLTATGKFSDGSTRNLTQSVTWKSSVAGVASVAPSGAVLGSALGAATITATSGSVNGSASITVGQAVLLGITVSPNQSSVPDGETVQLTANGNYSDGSTQNLTQSVTWSSSSSAIATVSSSGFVGANALGSATITATAGSMKGTAAITVTPAVVVSLDIVPTTLSLVLGGSKQLQAQATWSDGTTQNVTATASWSSINAGIVSVSSPGIATAWQVGSTTVFASYSGATATANATVMPLMLVSYYSLINSQATGIDGTLYITNPGLTIGSPNLGNLCAMIYVFDQNQELNECCGCPVSDGGLLTLSLVNNLTSNTLTGISPRAGAIIVVPSDITSNPQCNAGSLTPTGALSAWETNVQYDPVTPAITEVPYDSIALNAGSQTFLSEMCTGLQELGSGAGTCSCGAGESARAPSSRKVK